MARDVTHKRAYAKYRWHKNRSRRRDIPFLLTFDEWWTIWQESGHWHERGAYRGQYQMARFGDKGPYAVGNVRIVTREENVAERFPLGAARAILRIDLRIAAQLRREKAAKRRQERRMAVQLRREEIAKRQLAMQQLVGPSKYSAERLEITRLAAQRRGAAKRSQQASL
jgi:hypothetical protein